jgi:hypothetical protein
MSRLSSAADFRREIAEIDSMLAAREELGQRYGLTRETDIGRIALERRRAQLVQEMSSRGDARMPLHELDFIFKGAPVSHGTIETEFLAGVLHSLQRFVRAVVEAGVSVPGRATTDFLRQVRRRSSLRLAHTFEGSFGIHLETSEHELSLFANDESPVFRAVSAVVELLDGHADEQQMLDALGDVGESAKRPYADILRQLERNHADVTVNWATVDGIREAHLRPNTAAIRRQRLERVHVSTQTRSVLGRLDEAGKRRGYFEFIGDDGELIKGRVADDALPVLKLYFDEPCQALFTVTVVHDEITGIEKEKYRLDRLAPPGKPIFD